VADLDGFEAMIAALEGITTKVVAATPEGLAKAAHLLEGAIKIELSRTSHPPGTPTPSPPGSPPSLVTGTLRRSIQVEGPAQTGPGRWTANVGTGLVYSRIQELGGTAGRGAYLPPRPYMAPGLAAALPAMGGAIERAWADALR
jgi:phage gpG-like protein